MTNTKVESCEPPVRGEMHGAALQEAQGSSASGSGSFGELFRAACPEASTDPVPPLQFSSQGSLAQGRLQVLRRLGGGGMGTVYEALDQGRTVALKTLNRVHAAQVYRLKTEFRRLAELAHPNVVSVYELFSENEHWFFTMALVRGQPLTEVVPDRRVHGDDPCLFDAARLRDVVRQLIQGTSAIHAAGLVHRDLKPANVMLQDDGRLVIVDFGLVSEPFAGGVGQTVDNRVSGTLGFIAPELLTGASVTPASDWYAVGAIIHQLLTGRVPRAGKEPESVREPGVREPGGGDAVLEPLRSLCRRLLCRDPSARPTQEALLWETRDWAIADREQLSPVVAAAMGERFVGRAAELAAITRAAERVRQGQPGVCLVHGECGVGKTALLRVAAASLRLQSALVLTVRCSAWESVPYKGLDGAMDGVSRLLLKLDDEQAAQLVPRHVDALTRLFPALLRSDIFSAAAARQQSRSEEEVSLKRRAFAGCRDLFCRLGERHLLALIVDDLHWADSETIPLLAEILSGRDLPNLLLVASYRNEGARPREFGSVLGASSQVEVTDICVGKLTPSECRELVLEHCPPDTQVGSELLDRISRESDGLPFYVSELARQFLESARAEDGVSLPSFMAARIESLPPAAKQLLEIVAVAVRPITTAIASFCLTDVSESLRVLISSNLVRVVVLDEPERGFEPYADEVRRATLQLLGERRIGELHRTLAAALESLSGVEPHWLLSHYRGGGLHERAREYSIIAARRALSVLAFDHAASMYLSALEYVTEKEPGWCEINVGCAEAMAKAGRGEEAAQAYVRAAAACTGREQIALRSLAVSQWMRSGHVDRGLELLKETLQALGISWPKTRQSAVAQLLLNRAKIQIRGLKGVLQDEAAVPPVLLQRLDALHPAQTALGTFDHLLGAYFASEALFLALQAGEPKRLVGVLATESVYNVMLRGVDGEDRAARAYQRLEEAKARCPGAYETALAQISLSMCAFWAGRWRDVHDTARRAQLILREQVAGSTWEISLVRSIRYTVLVQTARASELAKEVPEELSCSAERGDFCSQLDLMQRMVTLHLMRDEAEAATSMLERMLTLRRQHPLCSLDHLIMSSAVAVRLYRGQAREARQELASRWKQCQALGVHRLPLVRLTKLGMEADCIFAEVETSAGARSRQLQRLAKLAAKQSVAWAEGLSRSLSGMATEVAGQSVRASYHYTSAARLLQNHGVEGPALVAQMRAARLSADRAGKAAVEESMADLAARGVVAPERWASVIHCTY